MLKPRRRTAPAAAVGAVGAVSVELGARGHGGRIERRVDTREGPAAELPTQRVAAVRGEEECDAAAATRNEPTARVSSSSRLWQGVAEAVGSITVRTAA